MRETLQMFTSPDYLHVYIYNQCHYLVTTTSFLSSLHADIFQTRMSIFTRTIEGKGWSMWANIVKRKPIWKCQNRCFFASKLNFLYVLTIQNSITRFWNAGMGAIVGAQKRLSYRQSFRFPEFERIRFESK